jgi:hypothetical protein
MAWRCPADFVSAPSSKEFLRMPHPPRALVCIALITLFAASLCQAQAAKKNLLKNPGLEQGKGDKFTHWGTRLKTFEATGEGEFHGGKRAVKIVHDVSDYNSIWQAVKVKPNTVYTASAWIRGENIVPDQGAGCGRIFIGRPDGGTIRASAKVKGTFVWHKALVTFNSRNHTEIKYIVYLHKSTGTLYIDDLELVEGKVDAPDKAARATILMSDLGMVAKTIKAAGNPKALKAKLAALTKKVEKAPLDKPFDYAKGAPYSPLHTEIYQLNAEALSRIHTGKKLVLWKGRTFDALAAVMPRKRNWDMHVDMMKNEYESARLSLTNVTQATETVTVNLTKLTFPAERIIVRQGIVVPKVSTGTTPDALRKLMPVKGTNTQYKVTLATGATTQLYFEINGKGFNKAGDYSGTVAITGLGHKMTSQLTLKVHDVAFPAKPRLHTYNYAYMYWLTPYEKEAIADMKAHYIDTFVIHPRYLPQTKLAADGTVRDYDFSELDKQLELHQPNGNYLLWMGFDWPHRRNLAKGMEFGTPEWKKAFTKLITAIDARMAKHGITRKQYAFYPVDEPSISGPDRNDRRATHIAVSKLIKGINPAIQVFADPITHGDVPKADIAKLVKHTDIVAPTHRTMSPKNVKVFQTVSKTLWVYQCTVPGKDQDPFAYYRLIGMRAWAWKTEAHGLWDYFDLMQTKGWSPKPGSQGSGSMVFIGSKYDNEVIVPSRRWKAWRDGVEDNEALRMLQDAVARKPNTKAAKEAKDILTKLPALIEQGMTEREHTLIRRKVLELLVKLK